jgi:hypothetical protein
MIKTYENEPQTEVYFQKADVPLTHIFGPGTLSGFRVWAEEAPPNSNLAARS